MSAASSVMKAAGKWMKRSCTVCGGRFRNDMNAGTALAMPFAIQLPGGDGVSRSAVSFSRQQYAGKSAERYPPAVSTADPTAPSHRKIQSVQLTYLDRGSFNILRRTGLNPRRSGPTPRLQELTRDTARYTVFR